MAFARRPGGLAALALVLALGASACGSHVDPVTFANVNGQSVTSAGAPVATAPEAVGGDGAVAPGDPGPDTVAGGPDTPTTGSDTGEASGPADATGTDTDADATPGDAAPASGASKAGSCDGFDATQTGISSSAITLANASDISGPVPGLFESAQQAVKAYVAYFNSTSDICGRKLQVLALDSRSDGGADQQAYTKACAEAFAAVGSMSAFDAGGAATAEGCGLPDLRSTSVNPERSNCRTCFSAQAVSPNLVPTSMPKFWMGREKTATQNVALLYINAGAAPVNAKSFQSAWTKTGWKITYFQGIDVSEFNYTPYVQQMKDRGVQFVVYAGPSQFTVRLQQAMAQQRFTPRVFLQDSTIYDAKYVKEAGAVGDGSYVYSTTALFDDFSIPEMKLYRSWLQQTAPGAEPNFYGLYAWSAARLFAEKATALGGRLSRKTMVDTLAGVKGWTGNGIHAPQQVGAKTTANCIRIFQLSSGKWRQVSPGSYLCGPLVDSGIGG